MSQVTSPVILDSTGQDIVTQLAAISAALAAGAVITGNTDTTLTGVLQGSNGKVVVIPVDNAPTDNSTNLVNSGGVKTALDGKANPGQLAYVETGTTASQNYTAGQYITLNGLLYTADTAIASGSTFYTSGGNKNLTECVGGGFNSLAALREWKFVRYISADNTNITSDISGQGYNEVLLILIDLATESTTKIQNGTAIYPIFYIDAGYECRVYLTYGTDIYFGSILKNGNQYIARVSSSNSRLRIYAR